jgi:dolichol-phosphate mannosyltransferase
MTDSPIARTVWVGLPAYNEAATIPSLFARFAEATTSAQPHYRIVLYNDGCTDATVAAACEWRDRLDLEIIGKPVNLGLGEGLREIIAYVCAHGRGRDVLVVMDCDDTHHPYQIPDMLAKIDQGSDVVIASRYRRGASIAGLSAQRKVLSLGAAALFKLLHPCRGVLDYTCGYRAYRVDLLQRARAHHGERLVRERGFACMVELLLKLNRLGARFAEVPLDLRYDLKKSASKMDIGGNTQRLLKKMLSWRLRGLD